MPIDLRTRWAARPRASSLVAKARARWPGAGLRPYVAALLTAVVLGLIGGSTGQWLGWQTAGALPTDVESEAIARLALGGPVPSPERRDELFGYDADGSYGPGYVRFTVPADPAAAAFPWQAKDVRVRLDTAGWKVDKTWAGDGPDESTDPAKRASAERVERVEGLLFVADKGDWRVRYTAGPGDEAHLDIVRVAPIAVPAGGLLGGLLLAVGGWFVGQWAMRRWGGLGGFPRRTALWLVVAGTVGLLPVPVLTLIRMAIGHAQLSRPQVPLWTALTEPVLLPLAIAAILLLVAAMVVVGGARPAVHAEHAGAEHEVNGALRERR